MAELFAKFEVNKTPWWPRVAHLVGGSCALHLVLTACVLYIPGLRSAFNLAGAFQGVGYVSEDYQKTHIGERAQLIEFPHERFQYPEGYFSNGEQQAYVNQNGAPIIVQQYTPPPPPLRLPRYRAPRPLPTPNATPEASPTPQASPTPAATVAGKDKKTDEKKTPAELEHDKKLDQIAAQNGVQRPKAINKKPFTDWLANANKMKESGALDLTGTIEIVAEADRQSDGKLINVEVTQKTGDTQLTQLAYDLISALSDSGVLEFLGGTDHLILTLKLDNTDVAASVTTEMSSEDEASRKAQGYSSLISTSSLFKIGGDEAAAIYKNTKVSANGKQIILSFSMPRQTAGDMLKKQLPTS
ncbi:MAG TPA: hypothetical protein VGO91_00575 [Pyrinomonadaceae bacterium]|jgi:hypothetical protein|nr:hypothetical protein [Pyrinomonadaceae bacterium]